MSFLLALVAFAAVFAVYSTIVTVLVEGLHKVFGLRSSGMSEMLRAFYDRSLASLQPANTSPEAQAPVGAKSTRASPQSYNFVRDMSRRSSSESLRPWYIRRWPVIGAILSSRQVRMTTLQFIERLAETPQGAALAGHDPVRLRNALTAAAYDFERLGEVQGLYFKARAKMLAVFTGIAVAFALNLDAAALYKELSTNAQLSSRLALLAESPALAKLQADAVSLPSSSSDAILSIEHLSDITLNLQAMGLPVGRSMFPHCENYKLASSAAPANILLATAPMDGFPSKAPEIGAGVQGIEPAGESAAAALTFGSEMTPAAGSLEADRDSTAIASPVPSENRASDDIPGGAPIALAHSASGRYRDMRCAGEAQAKVNAVWSLSYTEFLASKRGIELEAVPTLHLEWHEHVANWLDYRIARLEVIGHNPETFIMWVLGVGLAGGLLGLGAPFWFGLFARAASVVAPAARAALSPAVGSGYISTTTSAGSDQPGIRPSITRNPDDLVRGFMIALGRGTDMGAASVAELAKSDGPPPGFESGTRPPVREPS